MPQRVQGLGYQDPEHLQSSRELPAVGHLDDEMQVILLDAVVRQGEAQPLLSLAERSLEPAESLRSPEPRQPSSDPPDDVDRPVDLGSSFVRNSRVPLERLPLGRRQMFLPLLSRPPREQHELSPSIMLASVSVVHGSAEEPDISSSLGDSASFLAGRCS